jgi:hypothetical protein
MSEALEVDPLYDRAVAIVLAEGRPTCSLLQRELRIGWGRAFNLLQSMETAGLVALGLKGWVVQKNGKLPSPVVVDVPEPSAQKIELHPPPALAPLTGKHIHDCPDWDGLRIDETCPEFACCLCFKPSLPAQKVELQPLDMETSGGWEDKAMAYIRVYQKSHPGMSSLEAACALLDINALEQREEQLLLGSLRRTELEKVIQESASVIYNHRTLRLEAESKCRELEDQLAASQARNREREQESQRNVERRKHTQNWYGSHYGKLEDWARKVLPEPWRNQFFSCVANGTYDHSLDVGESYVCNAGFTIVPTNYFRMDTAEGQLIRDQTSRAELAEDSVALLQAALNAQQEEQP